MLEDFFTHWEKLFKRSEIKHQVHIFNGFIGKCGKKKKFANVLNSHQYHFIGLSFQPTFTSEGLGGEI